jgi:predicted membrane-bound spermidine synthase
MNEFIKRKLEILTSNPKTIFLTDGLGALLTALMLMFVLKPFEQNFGMPTEIIEILSITAFIFAIYSIACFVFINKNTVVFLSIISLVNLFYCVVTSGFIVYFYERLTILGISYFVAEIIIMCGIVCLEIRTVMKIKQCENR